MTDTAATAPTNKPPQKPSDLMAEVVSLCRRRAFIFQSSEIYGGLNGCWDYGPMGVELKRNIKEAWWRDTVQRRDDVEGIDCSILMNRRVWEASGHVGGFADPMVDCTECKGRFRADQLETTACLQKPSRMVGKSDKCKLTAPRSFNLMFRTFIGAMEDSTAEVFLRPETAQGIFANFQNVVSTSRVRVPFGIAQIGKAFRNEINPRNFTFRSREFEQMELEFFVRPEEAPKWFEYWKQERYNWYLKYGIDKSKLHLREQEEKERAHYAAGCADIEYDFPFGRAELEGVANRTDYDLKQHSKASGKDLSYFDDEKKERYTPFVIEPSAGADRATLAFLVNAYAVEGERTVMRFHPAIAPIKAAVLPLVNKDGMPEIAEKLHKTLKKRWNIFYDDKGAVGRRYRRQDEAGTPWCITIDGETAASQMVTIRHRDAMNQDKISLDAVPAYLAERLES